VKYMLLMSYGPDEYDGMTASEDEIAEMVEFMNGVNDELKAVGEFVDGQGLGLPKDARTIRYVDGTVVATDGPFGESKEVLAGFWIVECSAERAEQIAAKIVAFIKEPIEVREVQDAPPL
jgi:hypothetical protein